MIGERVRMVIAQALGCPLDQVKPEMTAADTPAWDSLGHLTIVTALEQEFACTFSPEEIMQMNSVSELTILMEGKLKELAETT